MFNSKYIINLVYGFRSPDHTEPNLNGYWGGFYLESFGTEKYKMMDSKDHFHKDMRLKNIQIFYKTHLLTFAEEIEVFEDFPNKLRLSVFYDSVKKFSISWEIKKSESNSLELYRSSLSKRSSSIELLSTGDWQNKIYELFSDCLAIVNKRAEWNRIISNKE